MFFSTELLSKRESGYGLLWLAATLGSKSKKLPRRSVLTADIIQLCTLISEPPEPLALRLSSNLMIGVVRVFRMKHEIFETDVGNCVASLKKNLQELHAIDGVTLEMAQPNGLREDILNLAVDPAMAMVTEFDGTIDDWDMIFRKIGEEPILADNDEFNPYPSEKPGEPSSEPRHHPNKKKLHQLDESHEHLFSSSFLNSLSGEVGPIDDPSSSANMNDVLFDLDFGDAEVGLGEEMERDLEEAWNMKVNREDEPAPAGNIDFGNVTMDFDVGFGHGGIEIDFADDPFGPDIEFQQGMENDVGIPNNGEEKSVDPTWLHASPDVRPMHTPPPHDQAPSRSILSRRPLEADLPSQGQYDTQDQDHIRNFQEVEKRSGVKKPRKRVTLVDPRTELTDEELKFQRDNYLKEMMRLRREAQKKKEQKEGKRRFEEELWAPPKYFVAPELVELWNQCVTYPVKAQEAGWRKELEELQHPSKRRRFLEKETYEQPDDANVAEILAKEAQEDAGFNFGINMDVDNMGGFVGDWGGMDAPEDLPPVPGDIYSGSRRSSDEPGQPRHAPSRPPSLPGSSLLGRAAFNLSQGEQVSNSIFPWDNAGPSSSNAALPGSVGVGSGSESQLGLSFDNMTVRIRKGSKTVSVRDSPAFQLQSETWDQEMGNDEGIEIPEASFDGPNLAETQESECMVTLERNSFNFLGYAKMHVASNSGPLYFSHIVPIESSTTRVAAEGFYHCLALATKDLISLEQSEPYGPIKIQIKRD